MNNNKIPKGFIYSVLISTLLAFIFSACSYKTTAIKPSPIYANDTREPDYSNLYYWAAHPAKKDNSDSVPPGLSISAPIADVFFIHPTSFTAAGDTAANSIIEDESLNNKTDNSSILYQASVFNENSRIFAPRYRQAHLRSFFQKGSQSQQAFELAYKDIRNAFSYYLEHYNSGRPIIISSHSQGTMHATRLIKELFDGKPLREQLICAYIIGLPVPENSFTTIPVCQDSLATGCFVSWRTFKSGHIPEYVAEEPYKAAVVNPLTWSTSELPAPAKLNKGGVLRNFEKIKPGVVGTQVHGNVLWSSKPDVPGKMFLTNKNYHIGDINLFYVNIRENVKSRMRRFLEKNYKP